MLKLVFLMLATEIVLASENIKRTKKIIYRQLHSTLDLS